jgi:hypothetical protein
MSTYLQEVFSQTADDGYFDFARCMRDDGTIYASPTDTCRKGKKIDGDEVPAKKTSSERKMQLTAKIKAMSAADLQKIADDPRLSDRQKRKLQRLIKAKKTETPTTSAAKIARPVDSKVAAKVDKAMKKKNEDPFTPEQKAAQDALLKKQLESQPTQKKKVGRTVQEEVDRAVLRGEVKLDRKKAEEQYGWVPTSIEGIAQMKQSYKTMQSLMKDPTWQTPANRARMINMRLLIYAREKELRQRNTPGRDPKTYEVALKESPKYDKTPGSTKPIPKPKEADVAALERERVRLSKAFDKEKDPEKQLKLSNQLLDVGSQLYAAKEGKTPVNPSLAKIYELQGYNAKPELVATANDLRRRTDIKTNSDGSPRILYRGVTTEEFADQFKGAGKDGDVHYAGRGIFGNGTYAAAPAQSNPGGTQGAPIKTARAYTGAAENASIKVTAFALRKDANVVEFKGDESERFKAFDQWYDSVIPRAEKETGYKYKDIGEAAAALGIHAYTVPQRGEDYIVVLNRGAVIAAMDSQVADKE